MRNILLRDVGVGLSDKKNEGPEEAWTTEGWKVNIVSSAFVRNGDSISGSLARADISSQKETCGGALMMSSNPFNSVRKRQSGIGLSELLCQACLPILPVSF